MDYKGGSLRLLFAKKGQITLSKFSIPPLTASTSSWFIGIAIKNASGDTPIDARKIVTLTLKKSFDHTCTKPFLILFKGVVLFVLWYLCLHGQFFRECTFCCWNQADKTKITSSEFFSAMFLNHVNCRLGVYGGFIPVCLCRLVFNDINLMYIGSVPSLTIFVDISLIHCNQATDNYEIYIKTIYWTVIA